MKTLVTVNYVGIEDIINIVKLVRKIGKETAGKASVTLHACNDVYPDFITVNIWDHYGKEIEFSYSIDIDDVPSEADPDNYEKMVDAFNRLNYLLDWEIENEAHVQTAQS